MATIIRRTDERIKARIGITLLGAQGINGEVWQNPFGSFAWRITDAFQADAEILSNETRYSSQSMAVAKYDVMVAMSEIIREREAVADASQG